MPRTGTIPSALRQRNLEAARKYWGFDSLRPPQEEAIRAGLDGRDSLVVMPSSPW